MFWRPFKFINNAFLAMGAWLPDHSMYRDSFYGKVIPDISGPSQIHDAWLPGPTSIDLSTLSARAGHDPRLALPGSIKILSSH